MIIKEPGHPAKPLEKRIKLIVADIDGCLSKGSTNPFSPGLIARLIDANNLSRIDPNVPAITFCTGRPQPYVECLIQVTHGYTPALCESGTILFDPVQHIVRMHPDFGPEEQDILRRLREDVEREMVCDDIMFEPGKATHLTMLLAPSLKPQDVAVKACELASRYGGRVSVETSRICVHFLLDTVNKGSGVTWLGRELGIGLDEMAGVGDATPDIPFLQLTRLSCAPADAAESVRSVCNFISDKPDAEATVDFLDYIVESNRRIG